MTNTQTSPSPTAAQWQALQPSFQAEHDAAGPDHATWCSGPSAHYSQTKFEAVFHGAGE
jgi:hypothetical protein